MAICGKDIQECLQEVARLSMSFFLTCVKTHPFVSSTLIILLLLYLCFPWIFWLVIYSTIFLFLAASTAKIYFSFINKKNPKTDEKKNNDSKPSTAKKLVRNDAHARSVRQRRPKDTSRDESLQTSEEEKSTVFSSAVNNITVDKSALVEEHPKEIREVQVDLVTTTTPRDECLLLSDSLRGWRAKKFDAAGKGDRESVSSESTEEDERDKIENSKAVQWSEDDQKNLMDLGLSEIERNKRLESLIARRRARKLLSLQVRRTLMHLDKNQQFGRINPLTIPRINPFFPANNNNQPGPFSPMPGSAPSVLIPMDNPFDLPYDPQEEKPILTGGSFHQEFLPVLQKDMFCRHESFSRGPFFPGEKSLDERETSHFHGAAIRRSFDPKLDSKDTDKIIEVESSQPPESNNSDIGKDYIDNKHVQSPEMGLDAVVVGDQEEDTEDIQTKVMLIDDSSGHPSSESSSEQDEPFHRIGKREILGSLAFQRSMSLNRNSRSETGFDDSNGSGPSSFDKNKNEDRFFFPNKALLMHHKTTFSIASDLQVEYSENSSPRLTLNGSFSSFEGDVSLSEGNMERGINNSSGEDTSAASSCRPSGGDENESRLRDIHEVREDNNPIDIGFSPDPGAKQKMDDKMIEEHSQSISAAELPDGSQSQTSRTLQMVAGSDSSHAIPTKTVGFPAVEQELRPPRPPKSESHKIEQSSHSLENFPGEFHTPYNANYSSILQKQDPGADFLMREGGRPQAEWSLTSSPTSVGYPESQCEIIEEHRNIFEYFQPAGGSYSPGPSEDCTRDSMNLPQQEMIDDPMLDEGGTDTPESIQDDDDEQEQQQTTDDQVFPELSGSFNSHRLAASVSFNSPRSVLQPKFSLSQSLSNLSEELRAEIQQFNRIMAENNVPNEPRGESFIYNEPLNTTSSVEEDSASRRFQGTDAEVFQFSEQVTEGNQQSLISPETTAGQLKPEGTSSRSLEERDETSEQLQEHEPADDATGPEKQQRYETSEQLHEHEHGESIETAGSNREKEQQRYGTSDLVHEHEPGGNIEPSGSNKHMEEPTEIQKQQQPNADDENKSGFNTSVEGMEVDPAAIEGAEHISLDDHIPGIKTQEDK